MKKNTTLYFILISALALSFSVFATANTLTAKHKEKDNSVLVDAVNANNRGNINDSIGLTATAVQFETSESEQVASFRIAPFTGKNGLFVKVSFPVNKGTNDTNAEDFKGLANIDSVEIGARGFFWGKAKRPSTLGGLRKVCKNNPKLFDVDPLDPTPTLADGVVPTKSNQGCNMTNFELAEVFKRGEANPSELDAYASTILDLNRTIMAWHLSAEYGKDDYEFFSAEDASTTSEQEEESYSVKAGMSWFFSGLSQRAKIELQYTENYSVADLETRCPSTEESFTSCTANAGGEPTKNKDSIISVSYRWNKYGYAFAPQISHDIEDDNTKLTLPFYFFSTGTDLDSGVRFDWDTDKQDSKLSLFISKTFSLHD